MANTLPPISYKNVPTSTDPQDKLGVPRALDCMEMALTTQSNLIESLINRLGPILFDGGVEAKKDNVSLASECALQRLLYMRLDDIEKSNDGLRFIIDRLQI